MPERSYLSGTAGRGKFTGKERDAGAGWDYFIRSAHQSLRSCGARYYPPNIGRWMGVDPLADKYPGWTPYNYVMNNPLRLVDPHGRAPSRSSGCDCRTRERNRDRHKW